MLVYYLLCEPKPKQKCGLVLPSYLQKSKKTIDFVFVLKKSVAKFAGRSKKIAKLAAEINIRIVLENEHNFKKLFVKTKVA